MQCCGPIQDITTMDDRSPVYLCGRCGKQGPMSAFPDPLPEPPKPMSPIYKAREWLADVLERFAYWISPE